MRPREGDDDVKTATARRAGRKGTWTPKTMLGIFRSLGSLARAITPMLAGIVFWRLGATSVFMGGAAMAVLAFALSTTLPKPVK